MFQPYDLTPLDHAGPVVHLNPTLSFNLTGKNRLEVLRRAEDALDRLLSEFPVLTGMVVPSTHADGKSNAFHVRPASADEIEDQPFFIAHNHVEHTPLTLNGRFNPALTPFPILSPPRSPSPVLRLKANVIGDRLHLVWCFDHRVMDGLGFLTLLTTFAAFCRDPDTSGRLITTPHKQERARQHIDDIASTSERLGLSWTRFPHPPSEDEMFKDPSQVPISSYHVLDARKIKMLYDACTVILYSLPERYRRGFPDVFFPPSLVVTALVGFCGSRARSRAFPDQQKQPSNVFVAANIRKAAELPSSYLGNAILAVESACDSAVPPPREALENIHVPGPLGTAEPEDIWRIWNTARNLQQQFNRLDSHRVQGMIATMSDKRDWSSFRPGFGVNMHVSDIRATSLYVNYGPLGIPELIDLPFDDVPGVCWIMPPHPSDPPSSYPCWRLRMILERTAMECLSNDPLFQWVTTPSPASRSAKL
ncbi:hypothetical protein N7457_002975 [Penicillium paradoxum]|uniref:uncharacterized protein n=1 Tax=Penicillium paradoxum TaxID=176176 RepID=UPI002548250B|nr:uncharacterized protein N7457_002975 [Penicillium paradoxum]KAJ5787985.1 hypothetical protein N7457_002975 [Penicillium paradoxum]